MFRGDGVPVNVPYFSSLALVPHQDHFYQCRLMRAQTREHGLIHDELHHDGSMHDGLNYGGLNHDSLNHGGLNHDGLVYAGLKYDKILHGRLACDCSVPIDLVQNFQDM